MCVLQPSKVWLFKCQDFMSLYFRELEQFTEWVAVLWQVWEIMKQPSAFLKPGVWAVSFQRLCDPKEPCTAAWPGPKEFLFADSGGPSSGHKSALRFFWQPSQWQLGTSPIRKADPLVTQDPKRHCWDGLSLSELTCVSCSWIATLPLFTDDLLCWPYLSWQLRRWPCL